MPSGETTPKPPPPKFPRPPPFRVEKLVRRTGQSHRWPALGSRRNDLHRDGVHHLYSFRGADRRGRDAGVPAHEHGVHLRERKIELQAPATLAAWRLARGDVPKRP